MAGFSWNTAAVGGAVSTISNWIGSLIAAKAAVASAQWLGAAMPNEVQTAITALVGGGIVAFAVWLTPDNGYVYSPQAAQPHVNQPPAPVTPTN
jgi:hypothetical protein